MKRLVLFALMTACGESPAPAPQSNWERPPDAGVDAQDASDASDDDPDAEHDAAPDTRVDDAASDAGERADTPVVPEPVEDPCEGAEPERCSVCEAGSVCAPGVCGGEACAPGRFCVSNEDCGAEGVCLADFGVCEPSLDACTDDRSCPYGFRCEEGVCADRRIPCSAGITPCPRGYICSFAVVSDYPFCVPGVVPCEVSETCEPGASCVDVNGDGSTECIPAGLCTTHDDCPAELRCGIDPTTGQSACVDDGVCTDSCPAGFSCADLGSGVALCVVDGGSCAGDRECPESHVCASRIEGEPPRCFASMEGDS